MFNGQLGCCRVAIDLDGFNLCFPVLPGPVIPGAGHKITKGNIHQGILSHIPHLPIRHKGFGKKEAVPKGGSIQIISAYLLDLPDRLEIGLGRKAMNKGSSQEKNENIEFHV